MDFRSFCYSVSSGSVSLSKKEEVELSDVSSLDASDALNYAFFTFDVLFPHSEGEDVDIDIDLPLVRVTKEASGGTSVDLVPSPSSFLASFRDSDKMQLDASSLGFNGIPPRRDGTYPFFATKEGGSVSFYILPSNVLISLLSREKFSAFEKRILPAMKTLDSSLQKGCTRFDYLSALFLSDRVRSAFGNDDETIEKIVSCVQKHPIQANDSGKKGKGPVAGITPSLEVKLLPPSYSGKRFKICKENLRCMEEELTKHASGKKEEFKSLISGAIRFLEPKEETSAPPRIENHGTVKTREPISSSGYDINLEYFDGESPRFPLHMWVFAGLLILSVITVLFFVIRRAS